MYTIQFGTRAHLMADESAATLKDAIMDGHPFVTVKIALAGEDAPEYEVMLNVAHVIAIIKHPESTVSENQPKSSRPKLVLVG